MIGMSHFFRTVKIENYRVFKSLSIDALARINIFGGYNGVGKTTLLEALFTMMDIASTNCLLRPFSFRRIAANSNYVFRDAEMEILLAAQTEIGNLDVRVSNRFAGGEPGSYKTLPNAYNVIFSLNEAKYEYFYNNGTSIGTHPGIIGPRCVMINPMLKYSPHEENNRLSTLKRESYDKSSPRREDYANLVKRLNMLNGDIEALELMLANDDPSDGPIIHGTLKNGKTYPIPWLGDGTQTLLSILLAIYDSPKGVVFVDEFESSIHHSKLTEIWRIVSEAAEQKECQLLVATHSRECIDAAAEGVAKGVSLQYVRLERADGDAIRPVVYDRDDLKSADYYSLEVR
jgi:AAA15 family ATPase/GTPase